MFKEKSPSKLDLVIDNLLDEMHSRENDDDMQTIFTDRVEKLSKLKEINAPKKLSPDAVLAAGAHLAGILAIVAYEQRHIIGSKALAFIPKIK